MPVLTGARRGTADDAVGGVVPGEVVRPGTAEEVVEVLRGGTGTVVPVGEGTKTGWAAPPASCDLRLDLRAREVTGAERARWWSLACTVFGSYVAYQSRTRRRIPVVLLES